MPYPLTVVLIFTMSLAAVSAVDFTSLTLDYKSLIPLFHLVRSAAVICIFLSAICAE